MLEHETKITTPDGDMYTFIVHPDRRGPFPVVLMLMDGRGIREELRDQARRLATSGYYVMLPNSFYREGIEAEIDLSDDSGWERMSAANRNLTPERAATDARALLDHASHDVNAQSGPGAVMGYCMGGRLSIVIAQALGERIAAAAAIHPGFLATKRPESPHRALANISARLYLGIAEHDPYLPHDQVAQMDEALKTQGVDYELEWQMGAHHGFGVPGGEHYHKQAAERVWSRVHELFADRLGR